MAYHGTIARRSFRAAYPVMLGYVAIGIPCGILESKVGLNAWEVLLLSATFYTGAGQFMLPNLFLSGASPASIIASISFVNTRQLLYSASFAPFFSKASRRLTLLFSATVTDESFGVNLSRFDSDESWGPLEATCLNLMCMSSWALANVVGVVVGELLSLPMAITSFAMTSIFICLLVTQQMSRTTIATALVTIVVVALLKVAGFSGPTVLLGASCGIIAGIVCGAGGRE